MILTPLLRRFCQRYALVDEPGEERHVHRKAVPRLGGIAIFLSILIALAVVPLANNLVTQTLRPEFRQIGVFLLCSFLVLLLGVYDDLRGANALVKFAVLGVVTTLFYALGGRIEGLSIPFVGGITFPPVVGYVVTLIWVVGIANAFNLIDGIDGLAAGSALFSSLVLLTVSMINGHPLVAVIALVITGALAGFLRYNFNPASIFLGDSGSLLVGFALAALSVQGAQKASTAVAVAIPILAFGLPVVDTGVAIARRFISGKPIFQGDREHIHHMLLARGWSQRRVALVLYGVSAAFGLLAMLFVNSGNSLTAVVLFVVGVAVVIAVGHLRYHEVDELRASVKRSIGDRRSRAAHNVRIRRVCRSLGSAATLDGLFDAMIEILELGEFVGANAELSCNGRIDVDKLAAALSGGNGSTRPITISQGRIHWSWVRASVSHIEGSDEFWTLRLPLSDADGPLGYVKLFRRFDNVGLPFNANYLTTIFQPAVTQAVEQIFAHYAHEPAPRSLAAGAG